MVRVRDRSRKGLPRSLRQHRREQVVVRGRSDHRDSRRHEVVGNRRQVGRGRRVVEVRRSDPRGGHRSSRVVVECGGGSHHGVGCSHEVGRGGRSSRRLVEVRSHLGHHGSLESGSGNAREDVGCRSAGQRCSGHSSP